MNIEEASLYLKHTSKDDFNLEEHQNANRYEAIQVVLQEIERLNNIIDELERWLYDKQVDKGDICDFLDFGKEIKVHEVRNKLQELKGVDKE